MPKPARTESDKLAKIKILVIDEAEIAGMWELNTAPARGVGKANNRERIKRATKNFTSFLLKFCKTPTIDKIKTTTPL